MKLSTLPIRLAALIQGWRTPKHTQKWVVSRLISGQRLRCQDVLEVEPNALLLHWAHRAPNASLSARQAQAFNDVFTVHQDAVSPACVVLALIETQKYEALRSFLEALYGQHISQPIAHALLNTPSVLGLDEYRPILGVLTKQICSVLVDTLKVSVRPCFYTNNSKMVAMFAFNSAWGRYAINQHLLTLYACLDEIGPSVLSDEELYVNLKQINIMLMAILQRGLTNSMLDEVSLHRAQVDSRLRRHALGGIAISPAPSSIPNHTRI